jgi:hypothetical protein
VGFQRSCKSEDLLRALSFLRPFDSCSGKTPVTVSAAFAMEFILGQQLVIAEDGADEKLQAALAEPHAKCSATAAAQCILQHIPTDKLITCRFVGFNSEEQSISLVSQVRFDSRIVCSKHKTGQALLTDILRILKNISPLFKGCRRSGRWLCQVCFSKFTVVYQSPRQNS